MTEMSAIQGNRQVASYSQRSKICFVVQMHSRLTKALQSKQAEGVSTLRPQPKGIATSCIIYRISGGVGNRIDQQEVCSTFIRSEHNSRHIKHQKRRSVDVAIFS